MHNDIETHEEPLERAVQALRNLPVPEGPEESTVQATLEKLRHAADPAPKPQAASRRARILKQYRFAAVIGLLVIGGIFAAWLVPGGSVALGDVIQQLCAAQTVQFQTVFRLPNGSDQRFRTLAKGDRVRVEFAGGAIVIDDRSSRRVLTLMPTRNKVFVAERTEEDGPALGNEASAVIWFERVKSLQEQPESYRGIREVDGRKLLEFRTERGGAQVTVLADPRSRLPVRISMDVPLFRTAVIMSDFVFDAPLADELFSLVPPAGYTVQQQEDDGTGVLAADGESGQVVVRTGAYLSDADLSPPVEEDVVRYLRALAEENAGVFPPADDFLDPIDRKVGGLRERVKAASPQEKQAKARELASFFLKWHRSTAYLQDIGAGQGEYVGEGVSLDDGTRPVLLWPIPDSKHCRVVFGDLSIRDVPIDSDEYRAVIPPAQNRPQ